MSWTIAAIITANLLGVGVAGFMQTHCFGKLKNPLIGYIVFCSMLSLTILAFPRLGPEPTHALTLPSNMKIIEVHPTDPDDDILVHAVHVTRKDFRTAIEARLEGGPHAGL